MIPRFVFAVFYLLMVLWPWTLAASETGKVAPLSSITFTVKEVATKRAERDRWKSDWGSYDKDITRKKTIEVELRNFNQHPAPKVTVAIFWVAFDHASGETKAYNHHVEHLDLPARATQKMTFVSPAMTENIVHYQWLRETYKKGKASSGYVVGVRYGDQLLKGWGSSQKLMQLSAGEWLERAMPEH